MRVLNVENAACRSVDPELFFPVSAGGSGPAKEICRLCDMRQDCLDWAIETNQQFGIWGGEDVEERAAEVRRRNKAERIRAAMSVLAEPTYAEIAAEKRRDDV